jgi:hypothetical protein
MALIWTFLMTVAPTYFDVPMPALSAAALALFFAKTLKTLLLYPQKVRSGVKGAVMASVAGLSLTHTVGKAAIAGFFTSNKPFLRTPKCEDPALFSQALRVVWQEAALFALCVIAVGAMIFFNDGLADTAAVLWMIMLSVQSLPYAASVITAVLSATSNARRPTAIVVPVVPPIPTPPEPEPLARAA